MELTAGVIGLMFGYFAVMAFAAVVAAALGAVFK